MRVYDWRGLKPRRRAGRDVDAERERPRLTGRGPRCRVRSRQGLGDGGTTPRAKATPKAIIGATWTTEGRFGGALRFHGNGEVVRVPAAASLNLMGLMTLSAWIRPSQPQSGWRTILSRQTDAYSLPHGRWRHPPLARGAGRRARCTACRRDDLVLSDAGRWYGARHWTATRVVATSRAVPCRISRRRCARACGHACRPNPRGGVVRRNCLAPRRGGDHVPRYRPIHGLDCRFTGRAQGGPELARDDGSVARSVALGVLFVAAYLFAAFRDASFMRLTT